jgi:hypothetical protein
MEGTRFDQFARTLATSRSRRRVLGAVLAGVLGSLRARPTTADDVDDSGTVIADASGGDHNQATVLEPAPVRHDREREPDRDDDRDEDKDKKKGEDKDSDPAPAPDNGEDSSEAVCPQGSRTFCCQCTDPITTQPFSCIGSATDITDCASECGTFIDEVLEADPGQEFTCVSNTCTQIPC